MSLSAQAKVLRVLQTGELTRVGGEKVIRVDVRVIAATNKDLTQAVETGSFRDDLFFRLNVVPLESPPLRARLDDLPAMVDHFVHQFCDENGFRPKRVEPAVIDHLRRYTWPGNVRELKNIIERVVIMSDETIGIDDLPPFFNVAFRSPQSAGSQAANRTPNGSAPGSDLSRYRSWPLKEFKDDVERRFLHMSLTQHDWNVSRTAAALGIERTNLHKKLKAYGLKKGRSLPEPST